MINSVNNISSSSLIQMVGSPQNSEKNATSSTSKSDSYIETSKTSNKPTYAPPNFQLDEFELNLSPEDLKYFVLTSNGKYRIPNVGAPIEMKKQWLEYSKKMSEEGFMPEDLLNMYLGTTTTPPAIIFFPPENASTEAKRAYVGTIAQMSSEDAYSIQSSIRSQLAGPTSIDNFNSEGYWNSISRGASNVSSYGDLFENCLSDLKNSTKLADKKDVQHMEKLQEYMNILIKNFRKYGIN